MAFTVILQRNGSDKNQFDKDISNILSVSGTLKQETSIIDPVIIIECNLTVVRSCNYLTISEFGRSYFVKNIRSIKNGLVEFTCHVDVLSSFKSAIRDNTAIIKRQQNAWNLYLNDGVLRVYQNGTVITKAFPAGFTTMEFVLAVAGSANSSST